MPISTARHILFGPILGVICILICSIELSGQKDSTLNLREIEVTAERIDMTDIGKHTDRIDSNDISLGPQESLASLLARHTPLFVRSYGVGTLATLGIRGGSASHTQILWNGIPLRNPMVGLQDLSLLPSVFFDEAAIHYGGHGAAFGSGAVGGLISISNSPISTKNGLILNLSAGSWQRLAGDLRLDYGFGKLRLSTRLFSQKAENDYAYKLSSGSAEKHQVHNQIKDQGILQEISYTLNNKEWLTGRVWYQYADRQIPPTSTQTTSKSAQQDEIFRSSIQWNYAGEKMHWQLKSAWLDETNDFQDSLILEYAHNRFHTWLAEGETSFNIDRNISMTGGIYTEVAQGESENYQEPINRNQVAAFSSIRILTNKWLWRLQAREELTDDAWSPLLIDVSSEWTAIKHITFKTSISRNYRTPTLNDLNWRPGGNPDLVPEEGWTVEAGIHYKLIDKKISLATSLTAYNRNIDQWIMWMPPVKDVRDFWSPINVAKVKSEGIEIRASIGWNAGKWKFDFDGGLDLTWSTFQTSLPALTIEEGDQLFYVPVENGVLGVVAHFNQFSGYYNHHWFGSSTGINDEIPAANIGSAGISVDFNQRKTKESVYLQVDNVWDVPYRIIERRPMPGRGFVAGARFTL